MVPSHPLSPRERLLAAHPGHALYWTVLAPILYGAVTIGLARILSPAVDGIFTGAIPDSEGMVWMLAALPHFAVLIRMMMWSERVEAGWFAGSLLLDWRLMWLTLLGSPALLIGLNALGAVLAGGDPNWALRDESSADLLGSAGLGLSMFTYTVILAPLVEEIGYRGIGLGCLRGRGVPDRLAIVITAGVFALMHMQYTLAAMVPVFLMGLFFGWLRIRSGGIAMPILAHMSANGAVVALLGLSAG